MANFYNPYMKGPDWGQGINQFTSQLMMLDELKKQRQQGNGGGSNYPLSNMTFQSSMPDPGGVLPQVNTQTNPAKVGNPMDGKLDIKGLGGQISQSELNMIMKVLQALQQSKGGLPGMGGV